MTTKTLLTNLKGDQGERGPQGAQGLPGTGAVPADSAVAGYIGTGGTSATQTAADNRYGRLSDNAINVMRYGAVGDGITDNTTPFRNAIADCIAQSRPLYVPAGTFVFAAPGSGFILPLAAGVTIQGAGKSATTLKIKNSSPGTGFRAFIGSNTLDGVVDLSGLTLSGFTYDGNTQGNPLPDVADLSTNMRAMVMVPKGSRVSITDIDALNIDGKWVVEMGTTSPLLAATQRVSDSYIDIDVYNFGVNSVYHDSSAVYFYGDRNKVRGTYVGAAGAAGAICAIEAHGDASDIQVTVDSFVSLGNATGCDATTNHGVNFHDCVGRNLLLGIAIWSVNLVGATGYGVDGLTIANNYIELNPDYWSALGQSSAPANFAHFGIGISDRGATGNLPMANVDISGNTIVYRAATTTNQKTLDAGICLVRAANMSGTPAPDFNISIRNNKIDSPISSGVVVSLANIAYNVDIDNNGVRNPAQMGAGTVGSQYAAGVTVRGNFRLLSVNRTKVIDDRGTAVANCAVDLSDLTISTSAARAEAFDNVIHASPTRTPVIGGTSAGGVTLRVNAYGFVAPAGNFNYGSRYVDYANGHEYIQTASPYGSSWNLWKEARPEGIAVGAAAVPPSTPTGLPYISRLTAAGPPSAAPTVRSGMTPMVIDSAGKIWIYEGSWKGVATA